jgi:undecaprenyl-diphosphatase
MDLMSWWEALVLGVVQGATEFLPVSSSGHLVVFQEVLGIRLEGILFEVVVHVATLLSILLVYRGRIADLTRGALQRDRDSWEYIGLLVLATIPAVIVGGLFKDRVEALFDDPVTPGFTLLVTGAFLWTSRSAIKRAVKERPAATTAFIIGLAQAFALVPGISRSGATVVAALWLGIQAKEAAAFSFLMAVPAIGGAMVLMLPDLGAGTGPGLLPLVIGGLAAAVTGVLAIKTFVAMLDRKSFFWFAPYCWTVGTLYLGYLWIR